MNAFYNIDICSLANTFVSLFTAFLLGGVIGYERQYRQRMAGLRTNVLVAVGAAVFVDLSGLLNTPDGMARVISYVVSGVGFLGAGVIMREEGNVRGLNTAATLWCSAAVGACAGADFILEAVVATGFILAANTLLRPLVNALNRRHSGMMSPETLAEIHIIVNRAQQKEALAMLKTELKARQYPITDLDISIFGDDEVEIEAILSADVADIEELDTLIVRLSSSPFVLQAFWSPESSSD